MPLYTVDIPVHVVFSTAYFWDVNPQKVFIYKDAEFVIDRIVGKWASFPNALEKLEKYYPKEKIRQKAIECFQIFSNEDFDILSKRYKISQDEFWYFREFK